MILAVLVEYGLLDDEGADLDVAPPCHVQASVTDEQRITGAHSIYHHLAAPDPKTDAYLDSRGISVRSPVLRFAARAPHRLGIALPAMIAPIVNVDDDLIGVHMTYLQPDGCGKVDLGHRDYQRECRGVIRGGAIRLAVPDPDNELLIGEGVESTLSAMELFHLPGWSAVSAGGIGSLELPPAISRIVIAADCDRKGAGQRNALRAHDRWVSEGRSVRIKSPSILGHDFNDVLLARGNYEQRRIRRRPGDAAQAVMG